MSSTTTTGPVKVTATDLIGQSVITAGQSGGPFIYAGPHPTRDWGETLTFSMGSHPTKVTTSFERVAPAYVPVPVKDERVTVTKRTTREARAAGHYGRGAWSYTIEGSHHTTWADTKREALADGARRLAIMDWHAENAGVK